MNIKSLSSVTVTGRPKLVVFLRVTRERQGQGTTRARVLSTRRRRRTRTDRDTQALARNLIVNRP